MAMNTSTTGAGGILPEDYGNLIVQPVDEESTATQVSEVVSTDSHEFHIPVVTSDPAAAFVAEGAEITPADQALDEIVVTPAKVAGLNIVSREMADDSSPAATSMLGRGLARSIAQQVDAAYFGNMAAPAPAGLGSITPTTVDAGTGWTNLDPFTQAQINAEGEGVSLGAFVANPSDAYTIETLKAATDSNEHLLSEDPTQSTRRRILGTPLYVSSHVPVNTVYGIPRSRALVVRRNDVEIQVDRSVRFTSDQVAVRAIMRVGFAYPHPAAIQAVTISPA